MGCSPIVILTEMSDGAALSHHAPYQSGTGDYGTWDARSALAGVTKRVMVSHDPAQAVQHTQLALKHALTGEPGPVAVIFHCSAAARPGRARLDAAHLPDGGLPAAAVRRRRRRRAGRRGRRPRRRGAPGDHRRQRRARRPGVRRSWPSWPGPLDVPVATTASGKGVFDETDPLAAGVMGRSAGRAPTRSSAAPTSCSPSAPSSAPTTPPTSTSTCSTRARQTLIQVDIEPLNAAWTFPADHVLVGDAGVVLDRLRGRACAAPSRAGGRRRPRRRGARPLRRARRAGVLERRGPDRCRSGSSASSTRRSPTTPRSRCDAGENRLFMMHWYRSKTPRALPPAGGRRRHGLRGAGRPGRQARHARPSRAGGVRRRRLRHVDPRADDRGPGAPARSASSCSTTAPSAGSCTGWARRPWPPGSTRSTTPPSPRSIGCDGVRVESVSDLRDAIKALPDITRPFVIDVPTSLATSFRDVTQDIGARRRESGY